MKIPKETITGTETNGIGVFSSVAFTVSLIGSEISAGATLLKAFFAELNTLFAVFFTALTGADTKEPKLRAGAVLLGAFRFEFILLDNSIDCYNVFPFILTIINT